MNIKIKISVLGLYFLCSKEHPEDSIPVPKHVGI